MSSDEVVDRAYRGVSSGEVVFTRRTEGCPLVKWLTEECPLVKWLTECTKGCPLVKWLTERTKGCPLV